MNKAACINARKRAGTRNAGGGDVAKRIIWPRIEGHRRGGCLPFSIRRTRGAMITGHISLVDHLEGPDGEADVCLGAVVERVSHPDVGDLGGSTDRPDWRPGARG